MDCEDNKLKQGKSLFLALLLIICLCACSTSPIKDLSKSILTPTIPPKNQSEQETISTEKTFTALQDYGGVSYGSGNDDGFYFIRTTPFEDGSTNIMYLDYDTKSQVYLCSNPNCLHQNDACTSWVPFSGGGAVPALVGNKVGLVYPGSNYHYTELGALSLPHVESMNFDGSERKIIATFDANQTIESPYVTNGTFLYFRLTTTMQDTETAEIVQIDMQTGDMQNYITLDSSKNQRIWGAFNQNIILYSYKNSTTEGLANPDAYDLILFDTTNRTMRTVFSWENTLPNPALFESKLVSFDEASKKILIKDLLTEEIQFLEHFSISAETSSSDIIFFNLKDDNLLFCTRTWNDAKKTHLKDQIFYSLDISTGQSQPFEMQYEFLEEQSPVSIIASPPNRDFYIVIKSEALTEVQLTNSEGVNFNIPVSVREYALINKQNYWKSVLDFDIFNSPN